LFSSSFLSPPQLFRAHAADGPNLMEHEVFGEDGGGLESEFGKVHSFLFFEENVA
jgi:hypothetical protein